MYELPKYNKETTRFGTFWLNMEPVGLPNSQQHFGLLAKVGLSALSLPHSNADTERLFSMLRKIQDYKIAEEIWTEKQKNVLQDK